eukprot:CAMPEP_0178455976 /NCGR_PEP_ID=MMETSP0689_2-20121128/46204_1 /TAXON_ID=160604 /ORGANISM="Amphidinium massartii, Strain CS-259" /LENGTH=49 /DNA_ID= /DNA_START= /DNA_END= /DNA_ORIENTATION=
MPQGSPLALATVRKETLGSCFNSMKARLIQLDAVPAAGGASLGVFAAFF